MTAIGLSYGIFKSAKKLFHDTEPTYVMFVDLGESTCSMGIMGFTSEQMVVKSVVNEHHLAGRDFDNLIISYLQEEFLRKTKIDIRGNFKAYLKLAAAAEKAKKTLSPLGVSEAAISVECLANDMDLQCILTREELEKRMGPLVKVSGLV
jgi:molecular chaperone DnaK (HSP70)